MFYMAINIRYHGTYLQLLRVIYLYGASKQEIIHGSGVRLYYYLLKMDILYGIIITYK